MLAKLPLVLECFGGTCVLSCCSSKQWWWGPRCCSWVHVLRLLSCAGNSWAQANRSTGSHNESEEDSFFIPLLSCSLRAAIFFLVRFADASWFHHVPPRSQVGTSDKASSKGQIPQSFQLFSQQTTARSGYSRDAGRRTNWSRRGGFSSWLGKKWKNCMGGLGLQRRDLRFVWHFSKSDQWIQSLSPLWPGSQSELTRRSTSRCFFFPEGACWTLNTLASCKWPKQCARLTSTVPATDAKFLSRWQCLQWRYKIINGTPHHAVKAKLPQVKNEASTSEAVIACLFRCKCWCGRKAKQRVYDEEMKLWPDPTGRRVPEECVSKKGLLTGAMP